MKREHKFGALIALLVFALAGVTSAFGQTATGTVEIDLAPALEPIETRLDDVELMNENQAQRIQAHDQRIRQSESDIQRLTRRVAALETENPTPPDPPDPPNPPDPPDPPDPPTPSSGIYGMNLTQLVYYTRSWALIDIWKVSDAWRTKPGQTDLGFVYKDGHPPPGDYALTWSGSGRIDVTHGAQVTSAAPNRVELNIAATSGGIDFRRTGSVRDVHLLPRGWASTDSSFHPTFIDRLRPFRVLRFMDWQRTNTTTQVRWSDRPLPTAPQGTRDGVALELMIELCNELRADAWFCMPDTADDDYVRRFARMVREKIHPDATIYIEWSNELWNEQFEQTQRLADAGSGMRTDGYFQTWAEQSRRDFELWGQVWEGQEDRLVRVLGVQLTNVWMSEKLVAKMPPGSFDALAPSTYFNFTRKQRRDMPTDVTANQLAEILQANILQDNTRWYQEHGDLAEDHGVRLISYEGGQHADAQGNDRLPWYDALLELQTIPQIRILYDQNLAAFKDAGGDLFMAFNDVSKPGKFGAWGHLEYQDQPVQDAPKYRTLIEASRD